MLPYGFKNYVNDADSSCCGNNYLDRDYWNDTLLVRNFLVEHAPINNIMYPQSTGLCLTRNPNPFVEGPDLWKALAEKKFWEQNNSPQSICPTQGVPILNACNDNSPILCPLFEKCSDSTDPLGTLPPWVAGIKKNIDADSAVKGLQYLNNRDCYENSICCTTNHELRENKCQQNLYSQYFQDQDCIYPNYTPKYFNNLTRAKSGVQLATVNCNNVIIT